MIWKPGCDTQDLEAALRRKRICHLMFPQFCISGSPSFWTTGVLDHPFVIFSYIFFDFFLIGDWRFTKRKPKGTKGNQKGIQMEPKGTQRTPNGAKRAPRELKGSQKGTRRRPKCITKSINKRFRKVSPKSHQKGVPSWSFWKPFCIQNQCKKQCKHRSRTNEDNWWKQFENRCNNCWIVLCFFW